VICHGIDSGHAGPFPAEAGPTSRLRLPAIARPSQTFVGARNKCRSALARDGGGSDAIDGSDRTPSRASPRSYKYGGSQHYFVCRHSSAAGSDARPCGTGFSREGVRWYATELVLTTNNCRSALARDGGGSDAIDVSDQTLSRASALLHIQRQPALFVCRHCSTAGRVGPALAGKAVGPHPNLRPVRVMCQRWSSNLLYALPMRRTRYPHTITRARRYSPCVMPTPVLKARS